LYHEQRQLTFELATDLGAGGEIPPEHFRMTIRKMLCGSIAAASTLKVWTKHGSPPIAT
jgi:hypothetical protein